MHVQAYEWKIKVTSLVSFAVARKLEKLVSKRLLYVQRQTDRSKKFFLCWYLVYFLFVHITFLFLISLESEIPSLLLSSPTYKNLELEQSEVYLIDDGMEIAVYYLLQHSKVSNVVFISIPHENKRFFKRVC
jgi:hypothetical protein